MMRIMQRFKEKHSRGSKQQVGYGCLDFPFCYLARLLP